MVTPKRRTDIPEEVDPNRLSSGIIPRRGKLSSFGRPPDIEYQAAVGAPLTPQRRAPRPIRIDPETVPDAPSYWDPGVWTERSQRIARGVGSLGKTLLTGDIGRRMTKGLEATGDVPPGAPWYSRPAVGFGATFEPELEALTAVGETTAPARGAAAIWGPYGFVEEEVRQRYDIHRARGLDPVSAMAAAYNQAEASPGEISGIKKFGLHALTDPAELLPGGILASLGRRAATSAARAGVKTAAEAIEQAGKRGPMGRKLPDAPAAPAAVPAGFSKLPKMKDFSIYTDDVISAWGRDMVVVRLPNGQFQPFYKRTGRGGYRAGMTATPDTWVPFDGVSPDGWINKAPYTSGRDDFDPLLRFGTEQNKRISEAIKSAEPSLPSARNIATIPEVNKWLGVSDIFMEQGSGIGKGPAVTSAVPAARAASFPSVAWKQHVEINELLGRDPLHQTFRNIELSPKRYAEHLKHLRERQGLSPTTVDDTPVPTELR